MGITINISIIHLHLLLQDLLLITSGKSKIRSIISMGSLNGHVFLYRWAAGIIFGRIYELWRQIKTLHLT